MATIGTFGRNAWKANNGGIDLTRESSTPIAIQLSTTPQPLTVDLARVALVVVDMQNDFCAPGGWLDYIGVDIEHAVDPVPTLNRLIPELRRIDVPIIWLNWGNRPDKANLPPGVLHVYNADGEQPGIGDSLSKSGTAVLQKGSWSAAIVDGLDVKESDIFVDKFRMSGFFDTELDGILRNLDVTGVLFAGVNIDQCVLATLIDAACLGYDSILLEDCSATTSPAFCTEATLYNVRQCFGFVANGEEIATILSTRGTSK